MKLRSKLSFLPYFSIYTAAAFIAIIDSGHAQIRYSAIDLGPGTIATALNDNGEAVGQYVAPDGSAVPFSYANGQLTTISIPQLQGYSLALDVNNNGVISGSGYVNPNTFNQPYDGFVYDHGNISIIDVPGGTIAAEGINSSGHVAGGYALDYSNFYYDPYTLINGVFTSLGANGQSKVNYALSISDDDTVVGYYSNPNDNHGAHAFSNKNGIYTDLGSLVSGGQSLADAINTSDMITGYSIASDGQNHAVIFENGQILDLGTLDPNGSSSANGINDLGETVGNSTRPDGHTVAFVDLNGKMIDLNTAVPADIGTELENAYDINDQDQIIAEGANGHAYLLSLASVPDRATTLPLLGLVFGLIVCAKRGVRHPSPLNDLG
jgi:probable HAF family extracellular repeat protein